jgi:hypothetical protein
MRHNREISKFAGDRRTRVYYRGVALISPAMYQTVTIDGDDRKRRLCGKACLSSIRRAPPV